MDKSKLQRNLKDKLQKQQSPGQPLNQTSGGARQDPAVSSPAQTPVEKTSAPQSQTRSQTNKAAKKESTLTPSPEKETDNKRKSILRAEKSKTKLKASENKPTKKTAREPKKSFFRKEAASQPKPEQDKKAQAPVKMKKAKVQKTKPRKVKKPRQRPLSSYVPLVAWYSLTVLIVLFDQMAKSIASSELVDNAPVILTSWLQFDLVHNPGAAFSLFAQAGGWQRPFLVFISLAVSVFLIIWLARLPTRLRLLPLALTLLLGGAVGNLIDRVVSGRVIDFISVHYQELFFPTFNIADSAITIGAVLLFIDMFVGSEARTRKQQAQAAQPQSTEPEPQKEPPMTVDELLKQAK